MRLGLGMVGKKPYRQIFKVGVDQEIDFIDAHNAAHTEKQPYLKSIPAIPTSVGSQVSVVLSHKESLGDDQGPCLVILLRLQQL